MEIDDTGPDLDLVWDALWEAMADQGMVDGLHGAEYHRCHRLWVQAGRPIGAIGFYSYGVANQKPKGRGVGNGAS
jgi:hypothetical protein